MKNRRKAVQPFEIKKRKIDIFRNYEANGFEKNQRKFENFSTLISKKSMSERITAQRYQSQWESWRQSHCDYSLRKQNDQQHLSLACYLQAARDRLDMLEGEKLETNSNFKVCLRRAGKIESHEILCHQEEYQRLEQILFGTVQAAENSSPQPKAVLEDQLLWEKDLAKKCKRPPFASIEQAANNYQCLCNEIYKRIRSLTGTTERPVR